MADDEIRPDDPFLERRLATLSALPVPERPTVDQLMSRGADGVVAEGTVDPGRRRSSHRSWLLAVAAAAVVLVLVSTAAVLRSEDAQIASGGMAAKLAGQEYWSTSVTEAGVERPVEGVGALPGSARITLVFEGDQIRATATCNTLNAAYTVEANRLLLREIGSTQKNCVSPVWEQDEWLQRVLASGPSLVLDGHRLTLSSGTTVIEMLDRAVADPDRPLAGTQWDLDSVVRGALVSSPPMPNAWMVLTDDGTTTWRITGSDGCNSFGGTIQVDGDNIGPSEVLTTQVACPGMNEDPDPVVVLDGGATYVIEGAELRITKSDQALIYRADDAGPPNTETTIPAPGVDGNEATQGTVAPGVTVPEVGDLGSVEALLGPRWELEVYEVGTFRTIVDTRPSQPRTSIRFSGDSDRFQGIVRGDDGCNTIGGDVDVLGSTITFRTMSWSDNACFGGPPDPGVVGLTSVLAGEATYETDGETATIRNGDRSIQLRSAGDPGDSGDVLDQGTWTGYTVAPDDRTVTFTLLCSTTSLERFDHADVGEGGGTGVISIKAVLAIPVDEVTAADACDPGELRRFVVVLDEPLGGKLIIGPPTKPTPPPPDRPPGE